MCESSYEFGTVEGKLHRTLRRVSDGTLRVRQRWRPTLSSIEGALRTGSAVILLYWRSKMEGHYVLILPGPDGCYTLVNDRRHETVTVVPRDDLKAKVTSYRRASTGPAPVAWFIRRR